ncbi:MAG: response regulator transcription factor [Elusimicrobia bacterium]|nr:response regulator transcription factor [Elusimicrobiota bacterium]
MGYRLLVISEDERFCGLIRACAAQAEHLVDFSKTGAQAMRMLRERRVDLAVLDSKLPDMEGLAWLAMARQAEAGAKLPVIAASSRRLDAEVAAAFELGAEDYVLKNCDPAELTARIQAVLRRRFEREERLGFAMSVGPIALDPARHECRVRGKKADLRPREFELLEILMRKAGRVLSRVYLLEAIWGMSAAANTRAVDVGISRLRLALGRRAGRWIETVERFGYRFRTPE